MTLIDTHAHLDHLEQLDQALEGAVQAGVEGIVTVSVNLASCRKNLEIKRNKKTPRICLAMGMHPSDADPGDLDACLDLVREHKNELSAIGEIGLDFWYKWVRKDQEKKDLQRRIFRAFLDLAKAVDLPAVIHTRGTWRECFDTVKGMGIAKAEFHWYSGPLDVLKDILDAGYYISASPGLAYSPPSREAIGYAPIERVMIETDSPVFFRTGEPGEDRNGCDGFDAGPKDVFRTLKAYCQLKNIDEARAAEVFNRNARTFFGLD
ncbi:MAG TPA: TatD family hydrolase [Candidatus Omnitrophota bacterium]|nr:TatD family hydrolase [Candidatus Omnitrophota bacterium]